jgi:hypothetical protein
MDQFVQAQDSDTLVWLHEVPNDDERKYMETKAEFEKTHFKIRKPVGFVRQTESELQLLTRKELFDLYENKFVGAEQFVKLWLKDPEIRTYERFDFLPPPLKCPVDVHNTWTGFESERIDESGRTRKQVRGPPAEPVWKKRTVRSEMARESGPRTGETYGSCARRGRRAGNRQVHDFRAVYEEGHRVPDTLVKRKTRRTTCLADSGS